MWLRSSVYFVLSVLSMIAARSASAGPALDDSASPTAAPEGVTQRSDSPVQYGVGLRFRGVFVPKGEVELFVARAGDNSSKTLGLGLEFTRRRGNTELQIGVEFEGFNPGQGVWIEKNNDVANGDAADVVLARGDQPKPLGWITFEFTFIHHTPITNNLSIRYGGGGGLGIVTGELQHYDITCAAGATNEDPSPQCEPPVPPFNGTGQFEAGEVLRKYKLPPVFPVLNALIGLQIKPIDKLTVNIEGGIRTFLFFGVSSTYFF